MKNLDLENLELSFLTNEEMQDINGGFISYLQASILRPLAKAAEFVIGEIADFVQGVADGYNAVRE